MATASYLISFLPKMAVTIGMLMFFSLQVLLKNWKKLYDPRTWLTIAFYYTGIGLLIFLAIQVLIDLLSLLFFGTTFPPLFLSTGIRLIDNMIALTISIAIFTLVHNYIVDMGKKNVEKEISLLGRKKRIKLLRDDVLESIKGYNKSYIKSKIRNTLIIITLFYIAELFLFK